MLSVASCLFLMPGFVSSGSAFEVREAIIEPRLLEAYKAYQNIFSYQVIFERNEVLESSKKRDEEIFMRFEKPLNIFMKWISGHSRGQQILFAEGYFKDELLVRPPGLLFEFIPIVHLKENDPRLTQGGEKRSIKQAGIGYFLETFIQDYSEAVQINLVSYTNGSQVDVSGEIGERVIYEFNVPGREYPHVEIVFSEDHQLPLEILMKSRDRHEEIYRYKNFQINVDRNDSEFRKSISPKLIKNYLLISETQL